STVPPFHIRLFPFVVRHLAAERLVERSPPDPFHQQKKSAEIFLESLRVRVGVATHVGRGVGRRGRGLVRHEPARAIQRFDINERTLALAPVYSRLIYLIHVATRRLAQRSGPHAGPWLALPFGALEQAPQRRVLVRHRQPVAALAFRLSEIAEA